MVYVTHVSGKLIDPSQLRVVSYKNNSSGRINVREACFTEIHLESAFKYSVD